MKSKELKSDEPNIEKLKKRQVRIFALLKNRAHNSYFITSKRISFINCPLNKNDINFNKKTYFIKISHEVIQYF